MNEKAAKSKEKANHEQKRQTRRATTTQKGTELVEEFCRSIISVD